MREALQGYDDIALLDSLLFGFDLGYMVPQLPSRPVPNHSGALDYPADVDAYLAEECAQGQILGPFPHPIFKDSVFFLLKFSAKEGLGRA